MIARLLFGIAAGATLGGVVGFGLRAVGGMCPLTCNPVGGMLTGALFGLLIAGSGTEKNNYTLSENFVDVAGKEHFSRVISQNRLVLVQFYADWCGPCQKLKPVMHDLADELNGQAVVAGVNVDKNREVASAYGVSGIPDVRIFVDGKHVTRFVGVKSKAEYKRSVVLQTAAERNTVNGE